MKNNHQTKKNTEENRTRRFNVVRLDCLRPRTQQLFFISLKKEGTKKRDYKIIGSKVERLTYNYKLNNQFIQRLTYAQNS